MKRFMGSLLVIMGFVLGGVPAAYAFQTATGTDAQMNDSVSKTNAEATNTTAAEITTQTLAAQYSVDASAVSNMRKKGKSFGEINATLAVAAEMSGDATATNIARVELLRSQNRTWSEIAQELRVNLADSIRRADNSREAIVQKLRDAAVTINLDSQIVTSISKFNTEANSAAKADLVIQALAAKYGVSTSVITDLRRKGRRFGEINILLALASELPGGVTTANITRVEGARYGGATVRGWGEVAHSLNLKLGDVVRHAEESRIHVIERIELVR